MLKVRLKQRILVSVLVFLLVAAGAAASTAQDAQKCSLPASSGDWWYVGGSGPGNFTKIQDAINQAGEGDTVYVFNGTYPGYVILNKTIDLLGQDKHGTVILGYFAFTLDIVAPGTTMSGFTIELSTRGEGIRIDSNNNSFSNNIVDMPGDRLRVAGAGNIVSGNSITDCYVYLSGDNNTIAGNLITNEDYGIYLSDCRDNIVADNALVNCGLYLSGDFTSNNSVLNNTVNGRPVAFLDSLHDLVLAGTYGQVVLVRCANITVCHQNLSNTTVGLQIWKSTSCLLMDSTLDGNDFGLLLDGTDNAIVNTTIRNNANGIILIGERNTITQNALSHNEQGVYLSFCDQTEIINNTLTANQYGIVLNFAAKLTAIERNILSSNSIAVMCLAGSKDTLISHNTISNNSDGINLSYTDDDKIIGNILTNNDHAILGFYGNENAWLWGNQVIDNLEGVTLLDSIHSCILNNTITGNKGYGLLLEDSDDANIVKNTITNNGCDGISLLSDNATIIQNSILANTQGISIVGSKNCMIAANKISKNVLSGISMNGSRNNTISGNSLVRNQQGISLASSSNNSIVDNNFIRNGRHALFEDCTNLWDGNYWGRPRVLPKLILGRDTLQGKWSFLVNVDRHPAVVPHFPVTSV